MKKLGNVIAILGIIMVLGKVGESDLNYWTVGETLKSIVIPVLTILVGKGLSSLSGKKITISFN